MTFRFGELAAALSEVVGITEQNRSHLSADGRSCRRRRALPAGRRRERQG